VIEGGEFGEAAEWTPVAPLRPLLRRRRLHRAMLLRLPASHLEDSAEISYLITHSRRRDAHIRRHRMRNLAPLPRIRRLPKRPLRNDAAGSHYSCQNMLVQPTVASSAPADHPETLLSFPHGPIHSDPPPIDPRARIRPLAAASATGQSGTGQAARRSLGEATSSDSSWANWYRKSQSSASHSFRVACAFDGKRSEPFWY
jgi:hypothetical protein